jgi:hypothetical protein
MPRPTVPTLTAATLYEGRHRSGRLSLLGNGYQPRHAQGRTP